MTYVSGERLPFSATILLIRGGKDGGRGYAAVSGRVLLLSAGVLLPTCTILKSLGRENKLSVCAVITSAAIISVGSVKAATPPSTITAAVANTRKRAVFQIWKSFMAIFSTQTDILTLKFKSGKFWHWGKLISSAMIAEFRNR